MPKSYRIRTEVGVDKYINVNLEQDWESLEVLSLKILANDVYTRMCADYGVVVGRVFVNNGFGLPNARVSVFIPLDDADELNPVISELYPYKTITETNEDGYRYNLLPKLPSYRGHQSTGSFPNVSDVLMDDSYIEVYDKYYRFTVKTNESGDFMIFGVPVGNQTIVMDVDLSDIGCFSLSPQDLIQQGLATESQVNGSTFKSSTNLRELPQIKNLVFDVDVSPFWGDPDLCQVAITRVDFDLTKLANINIQPTSIFMGSIISTTDDDALKVSCKPKNNTGNLCELVAGPGEVLAIRHTINSDNQGLPILEQYQIEQEGKVIDQDGTYLLNVPMNLDYVFTNEFGQQVLSDDPSKGIPTKGRYRFKFKWQNEQGLQGSFQRANFLVPNVREYGWSNYTVDPLTTFLPSTYSYTLGVGVVTGSTVVFATGQGLADPTTTNVQSYIIYINGQPYTGTLNAIEITPGTQLQIVANPVDPSQPQVITFKQYPQALFDLYRSYAFSTDWDDYVNKQEAIDCEDTFYEFQYNKVYTTAMFLDRYKNGIGRAKHLGIKEIDNRTCKSTVNTFPVNDIIRNFDPIFFIFNVLVNILTFPILVLLFVAHFIALIWPVLKYLLLFLGPYIVYQGVSAGIDLGYYIGTLLNFAPLGGPVISIATILQIVAQGFRVIIQVAAGLAFTYFYTKFLIENTQNGRIDNFPRIGLPMIAYPDCTSCDCDCGTASMEDDFDANTLAQEQQNIQNGLQNPDSGLGYDVTLAQSNSIIAPVNSPGSYDIAHPNFENDANGDDPFQCGNTGGYKSFETLLGQNDIDIAVAVKAAIDFKRIVSGYDVLSSTDPNKLFNNEEYLLHAPQPFLWSANKIGGGVSDERFFAYPKTTTFPQQLNQFNTRDKYFSGVNQIKTTVNPSSGSTPFFDQVVVVLMNSGTAASITPGGLCSFQDPNYMDSGSQFRMRNLTGATLNQFSNNAITGLTTTGVTTYTVNYANPTNPNGTSNSSSIIFINQPQVSQVAGSATQEQSYLQFPTDVEYYQLLTGFTVTDFINASLGTSGYYKSSYLEHNVQFDYPLCSGNNVPVCPSFGTYTIQDVLYTMPNWQNYEVCIFVRGVDPHTSQQTISYDISKIFGNTSFNGNVVVTGNYYLNVPIQSSTVVQKPQTHNTTTNNNVKLYFPSYNFTITPPNVNPNNYSAFTSNLPYFYLSTDDSPSYTSAPGWLNISTQTQGSPFVYVDASSQYTLPINQLNPTTYVGGGAFLGWVGNNSFSSNMLTDTAISDDNQKKQYYNTNAGYFQQQFSCGGNGNLSSLYSPAYYNQSYSPINFNNSLRIIMRSDRLPTSTRVENGANPATGFALHQNNNFTVYATNGQLESPTINSGGDLVNGESFDETGPVSGLTSTLTCEGMVPLECYSGSGNNVGVVPSGQCSIPTNRMINGCYCLLNKKYVKEYGSDVRLFLEWKVRFTMNFAACRGVFAQVFQNNWVNGVLYMFNFNKRLTFGVNPLIPNYDYCTDVIVFDDINNSFYYRSSPWNKNIQEFIGKNKPQTNPLIPQSLSTFPGFGYNDRQIQFPTTLVDLGPRDYFINEICCSAGEGGFGSYYANQLKSTSYQDNADIIQLGFLSRILNEGVRQRILPIGQGQNNTEGKGIEQFFNSTRGGYRIDGDWAQMLSINSEWKVLPFITENLLGPNANDYIFFGDNYYPATPPSGANDVKPVLGLFFQTPQENLRYRKIESPGIETYSFNPLIQNYYGYSKSQVVPNYKWSLKQSNPSQNIFGTEDNNWYTNVVGQGFFKKKYQDLDFTTLGEKYVTSTTNLGYIANYTLAGVPEPLIPPSVVNQGQPIGSVSQSVVVGAPYHFYFGLNNGKTALNRFYKLYVATTEE
jgi:hypothetical protein